MLERSLLRHAVLALGLLATGLLPFPSAALADDGTRIRISGRVLDRARRALPSTWVVTQGSRRTGALAGVGGRYVLDVPGGTMAEISRNPLLIRVQARRKGYTIGIPGGAPELAFELKVITDELGAKRLQVRSNDATVAAMLANAAVLENGTKVALTLDFVGTRGVQAENDVVTMETLEEVVLSAATRAAAIPPATTPPAVIPPAGAQASPQQPVAASPQVSEPPPPAENTTPPARDPVAPGTSASEVERLLFGGGVAAKTASPKTVAENVAGSESVASPDAKREKRKKARKDSNANPPVRAADVPPDTDIEPATPPQSLEKPRGEDNTPVQPPAPARPAPAELVADEEAPMVVAPETTKPEKKRKSRKVKPASPEVEDVKTVEEVESDLAKPRVYRPGAPEAQDAAVEKRLKKRPRARNATQDEIKSALAQMGLSAADLVTATPRPATPAARPPVASNPVAPPKAAPPKAAPPTAKPETSVVNDPPMGSAEGSPPPAATPAPSADATSSHPTPADTCSCRIQGTVEVVSNKPLAERTQVTIYLEERNKVADTIELFMGSPRQFDLKLASCGTHKLRLQVRSKQKYVLTTPQPVVDCTGGGYRQVRFVLEPIQRWTSAAR